MIDAQELDALRVLVGPVAERLAARGHRLYFVGGIVRDLLLGAGGTFDVDLTTDARPTVIKAALEPSASALWTQGERFGTIGARLGDMAVEVTTHRAESYDEASRKPVVSFGDDLDVDLSRRDFTINAMAVEVSTGELIDPYHGETDLADRRLRTPLDPEVSFTDDPLRMLRAARFIPRFDLTAAPELTSTATVLRERLAIVSGERIHDELGKLLRLPNPVTGLAFLAETGLLDQIGLVGASIEDVASLPSESARRAGLLVQLDDNSVGEFLQALRYSNADRRTTVRTLEAARTLAAVEETEALPAALRAAATRVGDSGLDDVVSLLPLLGEIDPAPVVEALSVLRRREDLDDRTPPLPGNEIMALLGVRAGPVIGEALAHLESLRLERGPLSVEEARAEVLRWGGELP